MWYWVVTMSKFPRKSFVLSVFTMAGLLASGSHLAAQATSWTNAGAGSDWGTAGNWSNGVPVDPMTAAITFGDGSPNAAQVINLGVNRTITSGGSILLSSTGNRDYTLTGGKLTLNRNGSNVTFIDNNSGTTTFTIDSDIDLTYTSGSSTTQFNITGANASARTVNLNGTITAPGTDRIVMNSNNLRLNLRGNNSMGVFTITTGEVVVYHANATGGGQLQGGSGANARLSLANDLTLGATTSTSTFFTGNMNVRIREDVSSSVDRVITFASRVANGNTNGQITIIDNINSTGRVILNMATTTGTVQHVPVNLGATGLLRFSQTGATTYGGAANGSGVISGSGDVEFTGGGTTTFTAVNTYTGTTTLKNASTLLLSGDGSIGGTSNLHLETGTTFGISGITPAGYTFSSAQTISGTGTVNTGNKNLTLQGGISPGNSPGTLTFNLGTGTLFLGSSTEITFDLGTASDLILLTAGTLNIGTGVFGFDNFDFVTGAGFAPGSYTLFQTPNAIVGSFSGITSGVLGGTYIGEISIQGNNMILNVSVIPEPSTSALLLGIGGLFALLRRRRIGKA
jgi:fibronectin-binding autotransporter adhesin